MMAGLKGRGATLTANLLIALDAGELGLGDHTRRPLGHQLHSPPQLRHALTLIL
jgi:hypothetical protein